MGVALAIGAPVSVVCRDWQATDVLAHVVAGADKARRDAAIEWARMVDGGWIVNAAVVDPKALERLSRDARSKLDGAGARAASEAEHAAAVAVLSSLGAA